MAQDWRRIYEERKTTPEEAVRRIRAGHTVNIPIFPPRSVLNALWSRREELRDVRLQMNAITHDPGWLKPGSEEAWSSQDLVDIR